MRSARARNLSTNVNETFFMTNGKPTDKLCNCNGSLMLEGMGGVITMLKSRFMIRDGTIEGGMSSITGGDSRDMAAMGMDSRGMMMMGMDSRGMMMMMMMMKMRLNVRVVVTTAIAIVPKAIIVIQVRRITGGASKGQIYVGEQGLAWVCGHSRR